MTGDAATLSYDTLVRLAAEGRTPDLEAAWLEHLERGTPAQGLLPAIAALPPGGNSKTLAATLLGLALESYQQKQAYADALIALRELLPLRPRNLDLPGALRQALTGLHGAEPWFETFFTLSGLSASKPGLESAISELQKGLERFERLQRLLPGATVYHRSGWGEGLVVEADFAEASFSVRFRRDALVRSMPFTSGLDVLASLPADDLRSRLLADLEGLQREAEERPELLVRAVARLHKNRATVKELKDWLLGAVVPEKAWASWWRKAKTAAIHDPYLAVDNPARPTFVLRERGLTPDEEITAAMDRAGTLRALLEVVGGPLSLSPAEGLKGAMLARLARGADDAGQEASARLEAGLLLARHGALDAATLARRVDELSGDGRGFVALAEKLSGAGLRREALDAFVAARPRLWSDALIGELGSLPAGLLDGVTERLVAEGRGAALANRLHIVLLTPSRQPQATLRLVRRWASGLLDGVEGEPSLDEVFMSLLHLGETFAPKAMRGDKPAKEVMKALEELLLAVPSRRRADGGATLLAAFARGGTRSAVEAAYAVLARCRSMPDAIVTGLHRAVELRFPDLVPRDEVPFWESGGIFSTRAGIVRRQEEYRVLLEEKIPENSRDIGRAASYGDLSENFEWTAAIEQQRQLTEKAAAMEAELKLAQPLEDQDLARGVVTPGTRVVYEQDGQRYTISILGPWDHGEGAVSYRAPLAAGMLGAKAGETVELHLPTGKVTVVVREVMKAV